MQIALIAVTFLLAILLYRMLNSRRVTYPFIKVTRRMEENGEEYAVTEHEAGYITIDHDIVVIDGQEYSLKGKHGAQPSAFLRLESSKLISVTLKVEDGEKEFFIDPQYSILDMGGISRPNQRKTEQQPYLLSV